MKPEKELKQIATRVRMDIIRECAHAQSGHPGGSLGAAEMKAVIDYVSVSGKPCYIRGTRSKVDDVFAEGTICDVRKINALKMAEGQQYSQLDSWCRHHSRQLNN